MYDFDLICIGSGPAGQRAATQAAKIGKRVALIERRRVVGGVCVETGTIPSKTFREAVRSFTSAASLDTGLVRRSKPTIAQLLSRIEDVVARETEVQFDQLQRNDIEVICGSARFRDAHTIEVHVPGGMRLMSAEYILIAVGTEPSSPPSVSPDGRTVITSDGILSCERLPRSLAVVGAGVIGIEYASMFAAIGVEVTVIDKRTRPLEFLDYEIIDELNHQMRDRRVVFRFGEAVADIEVLEGAHPQGMIELESGKHIVADMILYSAGRVGATAGLDLPAAGLTADDRGRLTVDGEQRTPVRHIFAAGDVIGFPSLAATSAEQGRVAACHMFGLEARTVSTHFPIGIYSIPEISMVGETEEQLTARKIPYEIGLARYREIARGQILGDETGMFKMLFHRETRALLGVHVIGTGATELIHVGQAVLALGGGLDYFMENVFNYPTFAECYKVAAYNAANKLRKVTRAMQQGVPDTPGTPVVA
jgi:NAD(P) transhydrogenase